MKYQLVLQFPADGLADFDELIDLEKALKITLSEIAKVDGHDFGAGELNIFILTNDPVRAFTLTEPFIEATKHIQRFEAAYRELGHEKFTMLWPPGLEHFEVA